MIDGHPWGCVLSKPRLGNANIKPGHYPRILSQLILMILYRFSERYKVLYRNNLKMATKGFLPGSQLLRLEMGLALSHCNEDRFPDLTLYQSPPASLSASSIYVYCSCSGVSITHKHRIPRNILATSYILD